MLQNIHETTETQLKDHGLPSSFTLKTNWIIRSVKMHTFPSKEARNC